MKNLSKWNREEIMNMEQRYRAQFINSLPGYKSAFLVGTQDTLDQTNLAIISSITHLGSHPPLMSMIMRPNSVPRHTIENLKATGFFTFNAVSVDRVEDAHQTSARYERNQSEFSECNFTPEWEEGIVAPFVKESPLQIGLKLKQIIPLEINGCDLVIGEVILVKAPQEIIQSDGAINISDLDIASVTGLDRYHRSEELTRLTYAKPDKNPLEMTEK